MSRPLRIEFKNAWYHVMNRGASRRRIFQTDEQRAYFLTLLSHTSERFDADWHAYCLMDNHYHLMLHTPAGNLQRIMRHINGVYTQYYNRCEGKDGALFKGRYKAILVDAESYWPQLSRYIHRNPLEAGIVEDLGDYFWSSYPAYTKARKAPDWLSMAYILQAVNQKSGRMAYKRYVAAGTDEETARFYSRNSQSSVHGNESFLQRALKGRVPTIDLPEIKRLRGRITIDRVIRATATHCGVTQVEIKRSRRGRGVRSPARSIAMYLCQEVAGMTLSDIATRFGLSSYASAGSTIRNVRLKRKEDRDLDEIINNIKLDLTL